MSKEFRIAKYADKVEVRITEEVTTSFELDLDDVYELHSDLGKFLNGLAEREIAKKQNDSKNKLAEDMRRCFVDLLDTEYVQKELKVYQLDPLSREVIVSNKNLKNGK